MAVTLSSSTCVLGPTKPALVKFQARRILGRNPGPPLPRLKLEEVEVQVTGYKNRLSENTSPFFRELQYGRQLELPAILLSFTLLPIHKKY